VVYYFGDVTAHSTLPFYHMHNFAGATTVLSWMSKSTSRAFEALCEHCGTSPNLLQIVFIWAPECACTTREREEDHTTCLDMATSPLVRPPPKHSAFIISLDGLAAAVTKKLAHTQPC